MKLPVRDVEKLEVEIETYPRAHFLLDVGPFRQSDIQREFLTIALNDEGATLIVGDVVVTSLSDWNAVVELLRSEEDLARCSYASLSFQFDSRDAS